MRNILYLGIIIIDILKAHFLFKFTKTKLIFIVTLIGNFIPSSTAYKEYVYIAEHAHKK